jgi:hypothetical protein
MYADDLYNRLAERDLWPPPFPEDKVIVASFWGGDVYIAEMRIYFAKSPMTFLLRTVDEERTAAANVPGSDLVNELNYELGWARSFEQPYTYVPKFVDHNYWFVVKKLDGKLAELASATSIEVVDDRWAVTALGRDFQHFHYVFFRTRKQVHEVLPKPRLLPYPMLEVTSIPQAFSLEDIACVHVFTPNFFLQSDEQLEWFFAASSILTGVI